MRRLFWLCASSTVVSGFRVISPANPLNFGFFTLALAVPLALSAVLPSVLSFPSLFCPSFPLAAASFSFSFCALAFSRSRLLLSLAFFRSLAENFLLTSFRKEEKLYSVSRLKRPFIVAERWLLMVLP